MPCFHPITAFQLRYPGPTGKRSITFNPEHPAEKSAIQLPCGRCTGCRLSYSSDWSVRLMHEAAHWEKKSFLTLTFADCPEDYSIRKKHVQDFVKRLRSYLEYHFGPEAGKIKYFACGEYGGKRNRPHYHMILFGCDFDYDRIIHSTSKGNTLYRSPSLSDLWGWGHAWIGTVTEQSCAYVARYVMKKVRGPNAAADSVYDRVNPETGEIFHVDQEFVLMSRKPAIGSEHFDKYHQDWYAIGGCTFPDGKKRQIPRVYDRWLEKRDPDLISQIKAERKRKAESNPNNSRERLEVREKSLNIKLSRLKREVE